MSSHEAMSLQLKPIISYPREAQVGKTYLMSIDVQFNPHETAWNFPEEEYTIGFLLNASPYFTCKPLHGEGWPEVVLHRFGGTYGPAEYLLTAADHEIGPGHITITLVNGWGIPMTKLELPCEVKQESEAREGQKEVTIALPRTSTSARISAQIEEAPHMPLFDEEQEERDRIDRLAAMLEKAGWFVMDDADKFSSSAIGIAIKRRSSNNIGIDFLLIVNNLMVGAISKEGEYESSWSEVLGRDEPLRFVYEMQGEEIRFTNKLEPDARSRVVFHFHRPETLARWLQQAPSGTPNELNDLLRSRLRRMPPVSPYGLTDSQVEAITNLEQSLAQNRPRTLLQMTINTYTIMYSIYRLLHFGGAEHILYLVDSESDIPDILVAFSRFVIPDTETDFTDIYQITRITPYNFPDPSQNVYIMSIEQVYRWISEHLAGTEDIERAVTRHVVLPIESFDIIFFVDCFDKLHQRYRPLLDYFDAFLVGVGADIPPQVMGLFNRNVVYRERKKVCIFYSHQDQKYLNQLRDPLTVHRQGELIIDVWDDTKIAPGTRGQEEMQKALDTARVAILLVSADFLASRPIMENALPPLLRSAESDEIITIPVIVSPCLFKETPLAQFEPFNDPSKPLSAQRASQRENVWANLAHHVDELMAKRN